MNTFKQYLPEPMTSQNKLDLINENFHNILFKRKLSKKRMKSFLGKQFYFKKDNLHIYYKVTRIGFKKSTQFLSTIVKEVDTSQGKLYCVVHDLEYNLDEARIAITKHLVERYQERLAIDSYDCALRQLLAEFSVLIYEDGEKENGFRSRIDSGLLLGDIDKANNAFLLKTFIATECLNKKKTKFKEGLDAKHNETIDQSMNRLRERANLISEEIG